MWKIEVHIGFRFDDMMQWIQFLLKLNEIYDSDNINMFADLLGIGATGKPENPEPMDIEELEPEYKEQPYLSGCFVNEASNLINKDGSLPLTSATYNVDICNGLSEVTLVQQYCNPTEKMLEISYRFPISPSICLYNFTATFDKKRIQGLVKEKEEAKKEYTQAVSQGKKAAYGQISDESKDIMVLKIGNIEPHQTVKIEIGYIEELSLSMNTFYKFSLPVKMSPRYLNSFPRQSIKNSFKKVMKVEGRTFSWDFNIKLRSSRKIIFHESSSHKTVVLRKDDLGTIIDLTFENGAILDRDFVFSYTTEEFQLANYTLGRTDAGSSVMVSFIPKFCELSVEDARAQSLKAQSFDTDLDAARGEYIFLLDRSGSMGGARIEKAKEALSLFLKSLPVNSYFNIVSFGSRFEWLSGSPLKNSSESMSSALYRVQGMSADFGGTVISKPLEDILDSHVIEGYPKQVFLLTDGEVSNTNMVIDIVRKKIKYARVHTIGIGNGASSALVKGCAEKGKGHYIFIKDQQNPSEKIIQLLNDSLTPVISKVQLNYDQDIVESIVPNPHSMPYILKNQVANFFITFKGQLDRPTSIALSYQDSRNNLPFKSYVEILPDSPSETCIDKMAHYKSIQALEESEERGGDTQDYLYYVKKVNKKQAVIDSSIKHQILSKFTAFICVEQELVDGKYEEIKSKEKLSVEMSVRPIEEQVIEHDLFGSSFNSSSCFSAAPQRSAHNAMPAFGSSNMAQIQSSSYGMAPQANNFFGGQAQKQSFSLSSSNSFGSSTRKYQVTDFFKNLLSSPAPKMAQSFQVSSTSSLSRNFAPSPPPTPPPGPSHDLLDFDGGEMLGSVSPNSNKKQQQSNLSNPFTKKSQNQVTMPQLMNKPPSQSSTNHTVKEIVALQTYEGFWQNLQILDSIFVGTNLRQGIQQKQDAIAIATYLIYKWLQKNHPEAEYQLIRKKALSWLKKQDNFGKYGQMYDIYVK